MSIKIFNGLKTDITDFVTLMEKINSLREEVQDRIIRSIHSTLVDSYIMKIDRALFEVNSEPIEMFGKKLNPNEPFHMARVFYERSEVHGVPIELDLYYGLSLYPLKDRTLIIPYCNNKEMELLLDQDWIQEYGYWDNVDPDEDCTDEEWEKRKLDWEPVRTPSETMFNIRLSPSFMPNPLDYKKDYHHSPISKRERAGVILDKLDLEINDENIDKVKRLLLELPETLRELIDYKVETKITLKDFVK